MKVIPTELPEVLIIEPRMFSDERGLFYESWNARTFADATGMAVNFVQDNHSISRRGVLRGIHYQLVRPQGKLVRVVAGAVLDVAVDLRQSSPRFGCWVALELSAENHRQLWVPPGFGHGFAVRSEEATFLYKTTDYWIAEYDRSLRWNDPVLRIDWRLQATNSVFRSQMCSWDVAGAPMRSKLPRSWWASKSCAPKAGRTACSSSAM